MRLVIECSSNIKSLNITFDSDGSSDFELLEDSEEVRETKPRIKKDRNEKSDKPEKQKVEETINFSEFMETEVKETQEVVKPVIEDITNRPAKIAASVQQAF